MRYIFTSKAEKDHIGITSESAVPSDIGELAYWRAHGYIAVMEGPVDSTMMAPTDDAMLRKAEKI